MARARSKWYRGLTVLKQQWKLHIRDLNRVFLAFEQKSLCSCLNLVAYGGLDFHIWSRCLGQECLLDLCSASQGGREKAFWTWAAGGNESSKTHVRTRDGDVLLSSPAVLSQVCLTVTKILPRDRFASSRLTGPLPGQSQLAGEQWAYV